MFQAALVILVCAAVLIMYRAVKGPTLMDRVLGGSFMGTKVILIIVLLGFLDGAPALFIDIALAYALINFIASLAFLRYVETKGQLGIKS